VIELMSTVPKNRKRLGDFVVARISQIVKDQAVEFGTAV